MKGSRASLLKSLRQENEDLRNNLKQLSSEIDQVLDRATQKPAARPGGDVDSKSIAVYQSKVESLQKEVKKLEKQAEADPLTKRLQLEKEIHEASSKVREATNSLKLLKKQANDKPSTNSDPNSIRNLIEELRQVQADFKDTEEKYNRNLNFNISTKEKLRLLEGEAIKIPKPQSSSMPDNESKVEDKKLQLKDLLNEKKEIRNRHVKITEGINKKSETQTKSNELLKGQLKAYGHNIKNLDTQLRIIRQSIKNLSRNPLLPSMLSEAELNIDVKETENKKENIMAEPKEETPAGKNSQSVEEDKSGNENSFVNGEIQISAENVQEEEIKQMDS